MSSNPARSIRPPMMPIPGPPAMMDDRGDPDAIIELQKENVVRESLDGAFPHSGQAMDRKSSRRFGDLGEGSLDFRYEVFAQSRSLFYVKDRCIVRLAAGPGVERQRFSRQSLPQRLDRFGCGNPDCLTLANALGSRDEFFVPFGLRVRVFRFQRQEHGVRVSAQRLCTAIRRFGPGSGLLRSWQLSFSGLTPLRVNLFLRNADGFAALNASGTFDDLLRPGFLDIGIFRSESLKHCMSHGNAFLMRQLANLLEKFE